MDCKKSVNDGFVVYTIKKGKHRSTSSVKFFSGSIIYFIAQFDSSAIYQNKDPNNQTDLNKLYGFSDCSTHHHRNSARFTWRWYNNELQIYAYCYNDGDRTFEYINRVNLKQEHVYSIEILKQEYIFTLDTSIVKMDRGCKKGGGKYKLYPYFGGDEKAPHDITIRIKEFIIP